MMRLIGYVVKFERFSSPIRDGNKHFRECFQRGAFRRSVQETILKRRNVLCTVEHGPYALAWTENESLQLAEDDMGLRAEIDLDETPECCEAYRRVQNGELTKMSFRFRALAMTKEFDKCLRVEVRTVTDADLSEISLMPEDAAIYSASSIGVQETTPTVPGVSSKLPVFSLCYLMANARD